MREGVESPLLPLWVAVLRRALADATGHAPADWHDPDDADDVPGGLLDAAALVEEARWWLLEDQDDFPHICAAIGIRVETLREAMRGQLTT